MTDYAMTIAAPGNAEGFRRTPITPRQPGPGEALVRHTAIGLNFLDIYQRAGQYKWPVERDAILGSEAAGVVEAVGDGVATVAPGDRVSYTIPYGAYTTRRTLAADRLVRIPDSVPDEVAATITLKGMTAHYLIHSAYRVEPGMTVLVHAAAGGVGLLLGQWLAHIGATAIGTAGGPEKVTLAREHGYTHVIDYRSTDFAEEVRRLTDGAGVHVVYDSVGRDTWRGSLACLRRRGIFVCFGQSSGPVEGLGIKELAAGGSLYATRPSVFDYIAARDELEERARALFTLVSDGTLRAGIRQRFALDQVAEAHRALESRNTFGASVLIP